VFSPRLTGAVVAAALCLALPAAALAGTVSMSGSTSVYPLAVKEAKACVKKSCKGTAFKILQGGSDVGIADVSRGRVTIGNASRDPLPSDPGGLTFNKIARDGVCVVTNPGNPVSNLSQDQIQSIFSGQVRNWEDVQGASATGPIDLVVRTAASGTQDAFQNIFMGQSLRVAGSADQKGSNGLVQQAVKSDKNAIGYVDFQFTSGTNPVSYNGVTCNLRNAKSGQYGGVRNFWMVTRGAATGEAKKFINFIKSSVGQAVVASGWVPIR
jgi:phosphate transport system substrate-binding protein